MSERLILSWMMQDRDGGQPGRLWQPAMKPSSEPYEGRRPPHLASRSSALQRRPQGSRLKPSGHGTDGHGVC